MTKNILKKIKKLCYSTNNINKFSNKNSIFNSIKKGFIHSWKTPMMPASVLSFHNKLIVRIFRVLGGLCILMVLSKKYSLFYFPLNYIILTLSFFHIFYILIIIIIKIIYGIKQFRDGSLDVKNSPLDKLATIVTNILQCWKIGCTVGSAGVGVATTSIVVDTLLEAAGEEKIFTPLIGKGVKLIIGGKAADTRYLEIQESLKKIKNSKLRIKELKEMQEGLNNLNDVNSSSIFSSP